MTNPYGPPPPRRLERSRNNRMLGGVCGGLATYLNMDPTLIRVLAALVTFLTGGFPILLYVIALLVMPEEGSQPPQQRFYPPVTPGQQAPPPGQAYAGPDPVWGPAGAPWAQPQPDPWRAVPPQQAQPEQTPPQQTRPGGEHSPGDSTEPGDSREPR